MAGRLREAYDGLMTAAGTNAEVSLVAWYYAGRFAGWMGDRDRLSEAIKGIEGFGTPDRWATAVLAALKGEQAGLEGRLNEARAQFRESIRLWREVRILPDLAMTLVDFATLLGPEDEEGRTVAAEARSILTRLHAAPLLARLDAPRESATRA
jgi:hypothetical protein